MALVFLIVCGIGAFVAIVLAQAALNRRLTRSENAGGWAGPIVRAVLPGNAFEVGVPWKAIALVAALLVAVFVVIPRVTGGPSASATSGEDCRQVMVLTPDHPAGVLMERCGPDPVPEVVYPSGQSQAPVESSPAPAAAPTPAPARPPARIVEPAPAPSAAGPPSVRLAPGEIVAASDGGVLIGDPRGSWAQTDGSGVVVACAGQGCTTYPTGYRVTR